MNIFEKAVRGKHRYATSKGNLTIEDLLGLSLQSLDRVGKTIMKDMREREDSLLEGVSTDLNVEKLGVVKYIIREKQQRLQMPGVKRPVDDIPEEVL